jgi:hypothetical protein
MNSEGPYKHSGYHRMTKAHVISCLACAYNSGRQAERKRCAKIVENEPVKYDAEGFIAPNWTRMGIVDKIRGGQDGE